MPGSRLPKIVFFAIAFAGLTQCIVVFPRLPNRLASHFAGSGEPNGWMSKPAFFLTYVFLVGIATFVAFYPARSIARSSAARINLPNKEYWLAPERRAATDAFFAKYFAWYACALLLTEVLAMGLAIQANLSAPPQMATGLVPFLVFGFIILNVVFAVQLFRRFLKKT